jgi:cytochrome P450
MVFVPILAINRSKALWGEDAGEFMPERWEAVPEAVSGIPGVWGNMLTFLGGPHACIGYRFTLAEMKAILYSLIRAFEFELAVPADKISKKTSGIVQRPVVAGEKGHSMPMIITPYHRS